jgi:thiosulfate reductase cytochrome b subunit
VFADLNVWADIIAVIMIMIPMGFWTFQIIGNTITGRYYQKFILKQWPHHNDEIPLNPKVMHAINLAMMISLGISGIYLRFPFFSGGREVMKLVHYVCVVILLANAITRVFYALKKDGRHFVIGRTDIVNAPKVLLYYTFLKKSYPHLFKYNIMQKMTYGYTFPALLLIQTISGFVMLWPEYVFSWSADYFGGITSAVAWFRLVHYVSSIAFLMMTMIHGFLAVTEDLPAFLDFFGMVKKEHHNGKDHKSKTATGKDGFEARQGTYRKSGDQIYRERGF